MQLPHRTPVRPTPGNSFWGPKFGDSWGVDKLLGRSEESLRSLENWWSPL